ncbi:MAG TPA: hypothetical protein VLJ79_26500 [Candidatus Binatia bacterium]|nr:hypothetical protein [Candidatus Binatia bacterium]
MVSPSLHAVIEDLPPAANVSKDGLKCALIRILVIVGLTLGFVRAEGLPRVGRKIVATIN